MKVTLISLDQEMFVVGLRMISSCLREAGYDTRCIFLPFQTSPSINRFQSIFPDVLLDELLELCKDSRLIGLSLLTNQFIQAEQVTRYLKNNGITAPILWGGMGPTVEPEECLRIADLVCVGEGEDAVVELVNRMEHGLPYEDVENIGVRIGDQVRVNPIRPLRQDLNSLPLVDYSCQDHFIISLGHLVPLTKEEILRDRGTRFISPLDGINYPVMSSRGCPNMCSYCCNDLFGKLYRGQRRLRWRSTDQIIRELKMIQNEVAPIKQVIFVDDNFTARPMKELVAFCDVYKKEINLPFWCQVSPTTIDEDRMEVLLDAGCVKVLMGIETANDRIAEMYHRTRIHKATNKAVLVIEKFRSRMKYPPTYQFIIDNPYETITEMTETLRYAAKLPKPWNNPIYSLMVFPGTEMYDRTVRDGLVTDKYSQIYGRNWLFHSHKFFQFWIRLYRANFPRGLLLLLLNDRLVQIMTTNWANRIWSSVIMRWLWDPGASKRSSS